MLPLDCRPTIPGRLHETSSPRARGCSGRVARVRRARRRPRRHRLERRQGRARRAGAALRACKRQQVTNAIVADLVKQGKIAAGSETPIARSGVGLMVRKGAAKPDLSSPEALKRAVLSAKSLTWAKEGASGISFLNALEKLGIADDAKRKADLAGDGATAAQKVASGQVDLGALLINEIMAQPGVEVAGPLPAELQTYTAFTSGVAAASKNAAAAKALVDHLRSPDARAAFKAKGQEPG
ncbi:MAG: ABC transporter substrate-binding protein [Betaproteobacteria bacterium]|nr:MAG: ABC transporter substrate-binding protein [Betaproteobacteria bacterium]